MMGCKCTGDICESCEVVIENHNGLHKSKKEENYKSSEKN